MERRLGSLLVLPLLLGCTGKSVGLDDSDPPVETGDTGPDGPCRDGGWGSVRDPDAALHVSPLGEDGAAGTEDSPIATIREAVERAVAAGGGEVAVWTGHYTDNLALGPYDTPRTLPVRIAGCGELEVEIRPAVTDEPIVYLSGATGVELAGLRLVDGRRALRVTGGASVHTEELVVESPVLSAVVIDGADTFLDAAGLSIRAKGGGGDLLAGIVLDDGHLTLRSGDVDGAVGVAMLVHGESAVADLQEVRVTDTSPLPDGTLGRALQIQWGASATVEGLDVDGAGDAGVFAIVPGALSLHGVTVSRVAGGLGESGETLGDGIVVTGVVGGVAGDPADFPLTLDASVVREWRSDLDRPGIYLENVSAEAADNSADPGDLSSSLWADEATVLSGSDSALFQRGSFPIRHDTPDVATLFLE